jgi:hypothetical protein
MDMRIIGDVHGHYSDYLDLISNRKSSVQVGDFGFDYDVLNHIDHNHHKIVGGNHDNYDIIKDCPHYLGDFGSANVDGIKFFFIRGELSVDAHLRTEGINWWREEELTITEGYAAIDAYDKARPDFVISHGCPIRVMEEFITNPAKKINKSRTSQLLDSMFEIHKPKFWVFGHHHNSKTIKFDDCFFYCLNELEFIDI